MRFNFLTSDGCCKERLMFLMSDWCSPEKDRESTRRNRLLYISHKETETSNSDAFPATRLLVIALLSHFFPIDRLGILRWCGPDDSMIGSIERTFRTDSTNCHYFGPEFNILGSRKPLLALPLNNSLSTRTEPLAHHDRDDLLPSSVQGLCIAIGPAEILHSGRFGTRYK